MSVYALFGILLSPLACTNNSPSIKKSSAVSGEKPLPTNPNANTGLLTLARVIKSNSDPQTTIDLIGDGSNAIGQFCLSQDGNRSGVGATSCQCAFEYNRTDNNVESFEVQTTYFESNLLRCRYDALPANVTSLRVRIHVLQADLFSNAVNFRFEGTDGALDSQDPSSFLEVKRYQCKDYVFIQHMFDTLMYDPFQSDSSNLSYPLNFYTTSMGAAMIALNNAAASGNTAFFSNWECDLNPSQPALWRNLNIFSKGPDTRGSQLIFPADGSAFDRSTFLVAKEQGNVFQVPLNTYIAPGILTQSPSTSTNPLAVNTRPKSIGYAARPIPTENGEVCPSELTDIPEGFHWAKLWAFRGTLDARKFIATTRSIRNIEGVVCDPGSIANGPDAFPDCRGARPDIVIYDRTGTADVQVDPTIPGRWLANRAFYSPGQEGLQACFRHPLLTPDRLTTDLSKYYATFPKLPQPAPLIDGIPDGYIQTAGATTRSLKGTPTSDPVYSLPPPPPPPPISSSQLIDLLLGLSDLSIAGEDIWDRLHSPTGVNLGNVGGNLIPFHVTDTRAETANFSWNNAGNPIVPYDAGNDLEIGTYDANNQSRFDFIFVVTPVEISRDIMEKGTTGNGHEPYSPRVFKNAEDCLNRDTRSPSDCRVESETPYNLWTNEISQAQDTNSNSNNFPLCVLQRD